MQLFAATSEDDILFSKLNEFIAITNTVCTGGAGRTDGVVHPEDLEKVPAAGKPLKGEDFQQFVNRITQEIAVILNLKKV